MTDERIAEFWLSISGLAARKQNTLVEEYGSALDVHNNLSDKKIKDYAGNCYEKLVRFSSESYLKTRLKELTEQHIKLLTRSMPDYPLALAQPEVEPPLVIYYKGDVGLLRGHCIAIAGTRRTDEAGKSATKLIAEQLAPYVTIVTGHATGVEAYAVRAALSAGGKVVIVAACGINSLSLDNIALSSADYDNILIVSEFEPDVPTSKFTFPQRNRLIAGLCSGVVVVQAPSGSGALQMAAHAAQQGRNVYAVPGNIASARNAGSNGLIEDGATILFSAKPILDDLNLQFATNKKETLMENAFANWTEDELAIYHYLLSGKKHIDEIVNNLSKPKNETFTLLSMMELDGKIKKLISNYYEIEVT